MVDENGNETKRRRPASRCFFSHPPSPSSSLSFLLPFPSSSLSFLSLSLFFLQPIQKQTGEHRRRVRPDGSGHEAAPGRHRGRHAEAPGEREERGFGLFPLLSFLPLLLSLTRFFLNDAKHEPSQQEESDLSETPEEDVTAAREAAEAAEAALAKAAADGE